MNSIQILIADDDGSIERTFGTLFGGEADRYALLFSNGVDEMLEKIVNANPEICLVREMNGAGNTRDILNDLREAGLKTPVVAIGPPELTKIEPDLVALGGKGVIFNDSSLPTVLRYFVRHAADIKQTQTLLDAEKDEVIRQLFEQQDARERAEQQSTSLVELAEDLARTKEELERLNDEKNKFFSIIAHDLRGPFNAILGYTELLARSADKLTSDQVKEYVDNAYAAGTGVFKLLENLLEWARLQMDRMECAPATAGLGEIVGQTTELLASAAKDKGIKLESAVAGETAYIDANMTETVIRNLISNAIKFTHSGGFIEISVTDSGVGMKADNAAGNFSLSGSGSTDGTEGEKGTGLGLLLSKELVERQGGEIYATSKPGVGSTFAFTVPKSAPRKPKKPRK
jgi:signal transduction histidine kinase